MAWVRFDDQMPISRKVAPLSDAAFRLWAEAICWANRNLTDGAIRLAELGDISKRGRPKLADQLVEHGLWHPNGEQCDSPKCPRSGIDGWVIHDYWDYQPSKAQVLHERTAKAERQRRYMDKARRGKDASVDTSRDASVDVTPPRPAPPRREAGRSPVATARRQAADAGDGREEQQPANGHPPAVPPAQILDEVRKRLRQASTKAKGARREGALDELRALTDPQPGDTE
jgi:hypothetical protein